MLLFSISGAGAKIEKHTIQDPNSEPFLKSEVGIYERKQELDQENNQEKKKVFSFFLGRFIGRERVFFLCFFFFLITCLVVSVFSFIKVHLRYRTCSLIINYVIDVREVVRN